MFRHLAVVGAMALLAAGCPPETPDGAPPAEPDLMARTTQCTNPVDGYRIEYPAEWHTNDGTVVSECRLFDPQPLELEPDTEIPSDIAVSIQREPVAFETVTREPHGERELSRQELTVGGRPAVCQDIELLEDLLRPAGSRSYRCAVDLDGETLIAVTHEEGEPAFETAKRVLDAMIRTLEFTGQASGGDG